MEVRKGEMGKEPFNENNGEVEVGLELYKHLKSIITSGIKGNFHQIFNTLTFGLEVVKEVEDDFERKVC